MRSNQIAPLLVATMIACQAAPSAGPVNAVDHPDPLKVVIITGDHPFNEKTFFGAFEGNPDLEFHHAPQKDHDEIFEDLSGWDYDVMVCYHFSQITPSPIRQEGFDQLLRRGVGLVVLHHATLTYPTWSQASVIYGCKAGPGGFGFHGNQRYTVRVADPSHPIVHGLADFPVEDETYTRYYGGPWPENHVLLTTDHQPSDPVLAWTRNYAHARVFSFQLGHDTPAYTNANFRQILARGIRWTAGRLPSGAEPALTSGSRFRQRNLTWAFESLPFYEIGQRRDAAAVVEEKVSLALRSPSEGKALEDQLAAILKTNATTDARSFVLRQLGQLRSEEQVPVIASLLTNQSLSHMARYALEQIGTPRADAALRESLGASDGLLRIGIINSLGNRRDNGAIPALAELARDTDVATRDAALSALGRIGSPAALESLLDAAPGESRAWAVLACCQLLAQNENKSLAAKTLRQFMADPHPQMVQATALRVFITAEGTRALPQAIKALRNGENEFVRAAAMTGLSDMPGRKPALAYAACLASVDVGTRIQLLAVLAERPDPAIRPHVEKCLKDADETVRVAALRCLESVADVGTVPLIARSLDASSNEVAAAMLTLERLPGPEMSRAILNSARHCEVPKRKILIEVLGRRGAAQLFPELLSFTADPTPGVRQSAIATLGMLVDSASLSQFVETFCQSTAISDRTAFEKALTNATPRLRDKQTTFRVLEQSCRAAKPEDRAVLLRAIAGLGSDAALDFLAAETKQSDRMVRIAAVQALASWPDARAFDLLWPIATKQGDPEISGEALDGSVRLLGQPGIRSDAERLNLTLKVLELAQKSSTRERALELLAEMPSIVVLRAVEPFNTDPELADTAASTTLETASQLTFDYPAEARAALEKLAANAKDGGIKQRARSAIAKMEEARKKLRLEWLFNDGPGGWVAANQCEIKTDDGKLVIDSTGQDPFIQVVTNLPPGRYELRLRMQTGSTGPAQFFWGTDKIPEFNPQAVGSFMPEADGQWHDYTLPLVLDSRLVALRFDPSGGTGRILVDRLCVVASDPVTLAAE